MQDNIKWAFHPTPFRFGATASGTLSALMLFSSFREIFHVLETIWNVS